MLTPRINTKNSKPEGKYELRKHGTAINKRFSQDLPEETSHSKFPQLQILRTNVWGTTLEAQNIFLKHLTNELLKPGALTKMNTAF